jgi:hypothetical protein
MKIIKSNPWGFGIHSPFIFYLVTKVIFGETDLYRQEILFPPGMRYREKLRIKLVSRLIHYFQPENIIMGENCGFLPPLIEEQFQNSVISGKEKREIPVAETYNQFVIGRVAGATVIGKSGNSVWILPDLKSRECKELFISLQINPDITITIEANRTGIIIMNARYQKQNYIIRNWFCF